MEEELEEFEEFEELVELEIEEMHQPLQHSKATDDLLSKKRDLTYDDILETMNLKVVNGELQYIHPQKQPVKQVRTSGVNASDYLNYVPRSKEEHQKMMRESIENRRAAILRARQMKSTQLLFTTRKPEQPFIEGGKTNHFLQFIKKPLR